MTGLISMLTEHWVVWSLLASLALWVRSGKDPGWHLARFGWWLSGVLNALPYALRAGYAAMQSQAAVVRAAGEGRVPSGPLAGKRTAHPSRWQ